MKKLCALAIGLLAAVTMTTAFRPASTHARPPYKKEFDAMYVTGANQTFDQAADAAKCDICHAGKNKKNRNVYGQALSKRLQKGDEKNAPKIKAALEAAAKDPSDPNNPASPTFGERIKSGKLPGG